MALIPYIIKTFRGGVSDENDKGIPGSFKHGYHLNIHKRNDSLSCGSTMATVFGESIGVLGSNTGTTQTGIVNVFLPVSDGSLLAFTDKGSIWCMSADNQWTFVYNDENGAITGAEEFQDNTGANYVFWATSTAVSRKPFPGSNSAPDTGTARWTDVTDPWKTDLVLTDTNNTIWHTMKIASGALMITNRGDMASYDYDTTWNPQVMAGTPGTVFKTLEERNDFIIMGSGMNSATEEGHIWSWVVTALNYVQKKKIPVKGVNALIYTELPLMQGGSNGELFYSDFTNVVPLTSIPGGGQCNPDGVDIENDLAVFGIYGGSAVSYPGIWSYGRKAKNRPHSLNYTYKLSPTINGSTISTIGAVVNYNGQLMASWGTDDSHTSGTTTEYGIDQVSTTTMASALYEGLEFDGGRPFWKKLVNAVKLTLVPMPASTSVSVKFKFNKETDWRYAVLADNTTTYSQTDATEVEFFIGKPGVIYEVGVELNPSAGLSPEVLAITSYLDDKGYAHQ